MATKAHIGGHSPFQIDITSDFECTCMKWVEEFEYFLNLFATSHTQISPFQSFWCQSNFEWIAREFGDC